MNLLAIDPGASGGMAVQYSDGRRFAGEIDVAFIRSLWTAHRFEIICAIEDVSIGFSGVMGANTRFQLGRACGYVRGIMDALGIPVVMIAPKKWQGIIGICKDERAILETKTRVNKKGKTIIKHVHAKATAKDQSAWKNKLADEARRRNPMLKVTLKTADALLILDALLHVRKTEALKFD